MNDMQIRDICDRTLKELMMKSMSKIEAELQNRLQGFSDVDGKISAIELSQALTVFTFTTLLELNKEYITSILIKIFSQNQ